MRLGKAEGWNHFEHVITIHQTGNILTMMDDCYVDSKYRRNFNDLDMSTTAFGDGQLQENIKVACSGG